MSNLIGTFVVRREIAVTQDRLWTLLTDAKYREAWGAPSDEHVLVLEKSDLREGGAETHRCGPKDNPEFVVDTLWYHLDGPNTATFTETLIFGGQKASVSLVTYLLKQVDAKTNLQVEVAVSAFGDPDNAAEMIEEHKAGWSSALERLFRMASEDSLEPEGT